MPLPGKSIYDGASDGPKADHATDSSTRRCAPFACLQLLACSRKKSQLTRGAQAVGVPVS